MDKKKTHLAIIVFAQFCCTSLWFASNSVTEELRLNFGLGSNSISSLTSAVQLGFISGTLVFALLSLADRFSPSKVFFYSSILGSLSNLALVVEANTFSSIMSLRFLTGFFLAGIYPVGMKIATDYYKDGLGRSLGYLVGALVVGTALPHLLKGFVSNWNWQSVIVSTSALATIGGTSLFLLVPDGPFRRASQQFKLNAVTNIFKAPRFRFAAFGYFGHMWELYTFWAFVPIILDSFQASHPETFFNIPLISFFIIGSGGIACAFSGHLAEKTSLAKVASSSLLLSLLCCLSFPIFFELASPLLFLLFLLFWGAVVVADSPLLSTLVAQNAVPEKRGTALTIVNCLGYAITILSIQITSLALETFNSCFVYMILSIGPALGLLNLSKIKISERG